MIVQELKYKVYGKFNDFSLQLEPGLNVIYGENESGKSTAFNSFVTLFYGFEPANREKHPYANWHSNDLDFTATLKAEQCTYLVNRKLMSAPRLMISNLDTGSSEQYRNEPLKFVSGISEKLYASVFHFTADHLAQLEEETWESIQEKLIFNYGTDYLRKTSDVISELETEINGIWRKDKRGNPLINQKQAEIKGLMKEKTELEVRYDAISKLSLEIETIEQKLERLSIQKNEMESEYKNIHVMVPIKDKIEKINILKKQIVNLEWHQAIDNDAYSFYSMLKKDVMELDDEWVSCNKSCSELKAQSIELPAESVAILRESEKISFAQKDLVKLDQLENQMHYLSGDLSKKSDTIDHLFRILFKSEYHSDYDFWLLKLNPLEIKTELYKYIEISNRFMTVAPEKIKKSDILLFVAALSAAVAAVLLPALRALGFVSAATLGYLLNRHNFFVKKPKGSIHDHDAIKEALSQLFETVSLPNYIWEDASFMFVVKLEQFLQMLFERNQIEENIQTLKSECNAIYDGLREILSFIHIEESQNIKLSFHMVLVKLDQLREDVKREDRLGYEIEEAAKRVKQIAEKRDLKASQLSEIELKFLNLGNGNLEYGFKTYLKNEELIKKIHIFEEELSFVEDQVNLYNAYESKPQISSFYLEELSKTLKELSNEIQAYSIKKNDLEKDILRLKEGVNLDELESQLLLLQEEIEQLISRRNLLMVTNEISKFASEKFRRENQPDILQKVSCFMNIITSGKYQEVLVTENDGKFELLFMVDSELYPISKAFSKGTIHQLFLAFRLAVIEILNSGGEILPIILDEAFVNWDQKRLDQTLKIIELISKKRQVIMFTCQSELLNHFENKDAVNIIHIK